MGVVRLQLITQWTFRAEVERVWRVLSRFETLPFWWPSFERADRIRRRGLDIVYYVIRGLLGLRMHVLQRTEVTRPGELIQFHSEGDLVGLGIWTFLPDGPRTRVVLSWDVRCEAPWMRLLGALPGARKMFERSHRRVMEEGRRHLAQLLKEEHEGELAYA